MIRCKRTSPVTHLALSIPLAICLLAITPRTSSAVEWAEVGMWTGAGFASLLYTPLKLVTCVMLGIGGGFSYAVTAPMDNMELSEQILGWGYNGDWLIRPDHLRLEATPQIIGFEDEIHFLE